jgi:hypothetical protein
MADKNSKNVQEFKNYEKCTSTDGEPLEEQ